MGFSWNICEAYSGSIPASRTALIGENRYTAKKNNIFKEIGMTGLRCRRGNVQNASTTKMVRTFAVVPFRKWEVDKIMELTTTGTFIFQQMSKPFSAFQQLLDMTSRMATTDRFPCAEIPQPDKILKRNPTKIFRSPFPRTSETLIMKDFWKKKSR